jgi:hypothetical protein
MVMMVTVRFWPNPDIRLESATMTGIDQSGRSGKALQGALGCVSGNEKRIK